MKTREIAVIFGTRPEAIKLFPVIRELEKLPETVPTVISTGQHKELTDQVLRLIGIEPDFDLQLMEHNQQPWEFLARSSVALTQLLSERQPAFVIVQGDTTSTLAGALAAYYCRVPVGHVEAGLRTPDKYAPFPEEMNRRLVTTVSDFHFAPTEQARENLLREGVPEERVHLTGNTVVDALQWIMSSQEGSADMRERSDSPRRALLLTLHRRESFGAPLRGILSALAELLAEREDIEVVFPVHPNPAVQREAQEMLGKIERAFLVEPLPYGRFVQLMARSYLIITDSGGIQEEAPILGKPTLVVREFTERGEAVQAGTSILVGTDGERLKLEVGRLLDDPSQYERMTAQGSVFGDGKAAQRIAQEVARYVLGT